MAESKLVKLDFENNSYSVYSIYVFGMLSLGRILISDLVAINLFMHSLLGILYLATSFFTLKVFLHEISSLLQG